MKTRMKRFLNVFLGLLMIATQVFTTIPAVLAADTGVPDLVVTDISWSPADPKMGDAVTFSATIKNQGTGSTSAGIINGVSFFVDDTQVSWSDSNTRSIAPGESITVTANGGPNSSVWNATKGSHTVTAWVDDVDRIKESNEDKN